ncbi:hypothetical protein QWY99_08410 [Flavobacterium branchiarum]|nr:hypothetical protein [Flavobacterium branchiarum]MDN3673068.1 hypothetical protein [Flavobacterium branchiarum]
MADKNTLKNWFRTGLKPTQVQFWNWMDSFWHKDEKIPITAIDEIEGILNAKAEAIILTNHLTDDNAHADLLMGKEDKSNKGKSNGYVPLNEFSIIAHQYLSIVNNLVSGGDNSLLSAEQGKILQEQIDVINLLLTSDDINLDTIQEIVDAIKEVEISLSTILVNDLTTGGTMKALTAEMGKILKALIDGLTANKVDKVAGRSLILDTEIARLAGVTNQDITGKQDISNQIEVSTSQNAQLSWHGKTIVFTANCTITIPIVLVDSYLFNGITLPGVTVTWAITPPKTWLMGTPSATAEKQIFTLTQRGSTNSILLLGV